MKTPDLPLSESGNVTCCHKLCGNEAVEAVDIRYLRPRSTAGMRHYELCAEHFASYFPNGVGWIDRLNAVRLRIQCQVIA